jgi:HK97 family phage portal protein
MGILSALHERRSARYFEGVHPSTGLTGWLASAFQPSTSGINVDEDGAFSLSAYWCAINAISSDIAKLPFGVYVREKDERRELADDQVAVLFGRKPNPESIPFAFRKVLLTHALGWGNGIAEIEPLKSGKPGALWQQHPSTVNITRERTGQRRLVFEIQSERAGKTIPLYQENVFQIFGPSFDGIQGVSVCKYARESLGLSMAAERFGGSFFGNSSTPSGLLKVNKPLSDQARTRLKESWDKAYTGPGKQRKVPVLEEGIDYQQIGMSPEDGQFLETRQFQIPEIARWFRMPPHKLMDLLRGTFSNIEHQSIEYVGDCLMPWMVVIEQEAAAKFFGEKDPRYCRHNVSALLRADQESRYRSYAIGIQWGFKNPDDVRRLEDENPLPDGQGATYLRPANMIPSDQPAPDPKAASQAGDPPPSNPANGLQNRAALAPLLISYRAVLADAYSRVLKTEADKVTRAQKRETDFAGWTETFYREHRDHVRGALFPAAEAIASLAFAAGFNCDPNAIAGGMADRHILNSRAYMDRVDAWEALRPDKQADDEINRLIKQITGDKP